MIGKTQNRVNAAVKGMLELGYEPREVVRCQARGAGARSDGLLNLGRHAVEGLDQQPGLFRVIVIGERLCAPVRRLAQRDLSLLRDQVRIEERVAIGERRRDVSRSGGWSVELQPFFQDRASALPHAREGVVEDAAAGIQNYFQAEVDVQ